MPSEPSWLDEKRLDLELRMLHLQAPADQLDPDKIRDLWLMRSLLTGTVYSLWRAMLVLPADDPDADTTDDAAPAKPTPFDDFMSGLGNGDGAEGAAYYITNAGARLMALGQAKGADTVLSAKTRAKCAQLDPELLMMVESGSADLALMWGMALHVFDFALADLQAAAAKSRRPHV